MGASPLHVLLHAPCRHHYAGPAVSPANPEQIYSRRRGRAAGRVSIAGLRPEAVMAELTEMGFDAAAAQSVLEQVGPSLEMAVQLLLGGSAGGAAAAAAARASGAGAGAAGGDAAARQQQSVAPASRNQSPLPAAAAAGEGGSGQALPQAEAEESFASAAEVAADGASGAEEDGEDEFEDGDEEEDEVRCATACSVKPGCRCEVAFCAGVRARLRVAAMHDSARHRPLRTAASAHKQQAGGC